MKLSVLIVLFFFADLAMFKEKHASKCEELDMLWVEVAELKSRPALLVPSLRDIMAS
jgi:hypothetical protein